jgi:DNA-binding XRE family transcriptional regulator
MRRRVRLDVCGDGAVGKIGDGHVPWSTAALNRSGADGLTRRSAAEHRTWNRSWSAFCGAILQTIVLAVRAEAIAARTDPRSTRLAPRLLHIRQSLQMTQARLASEIGAAGKAVVYQWESGKRRPSPLFWRRIEELID